MIRFSYCAGMALLGLSVHSAVAAVSSEEAKQLGSSLTMWGSERTGNVDGTIPAYTGERPKIPALYDPKTPAYMPDPYSDEKPLLSITPQNMDKYAATLTEGQKAMFKKFPNYRIDVFPTHRTTVHAEYILENTVKNATACKAVNNGLRLEGCYGGFPFPIPKTGNEVMWNHQMSHAAHFWGGRTQTFIIDTSGRYILQSQYLVRQEAPYLDPNQKGTLKPNGPYWKMRIDSEAPARKVGEKYVFINGLDPLDPGSRAWSYIPGQRRVKLAPDLAYDTPSPASGGSSTMDQARLFLGAQDRYDFKMMGKKEVLMMYHNYKVADYKVCPNEVAYPKSFPNPDCIRWELHRAWVLQGNLKPGFRHILPKRMFYFDEDSWSAGTADAWDASGKVYRVDNLTHQAFYFQPTGQIADFNFTNDLQTGIYYYSGGQGFAGSGYMPLPPIADKNYFSPEALAGEGIR